MEQFIKKIEHAGVLTGDLVWPAIIIFFFLLFRKQIVKGISNLTVINGSPPSNQQTSETTDLTDNKQTQPESRGLDPDLMKLVEIYSNLDLQNRVESIRAKDSVARDMADLVIRKKISRDVLAEEHDEGIILALAATIRTRPEPRDGERLLRVAHKTNQDHVKYRVALAFGMLLAKKLVPHSQVDQINEVITSYMENADAALQHRLQHTEKMLSLYRQPKDS